MNPSRWKLVTRIFESAVAEPQCKRTEFVHRACNGDLELESEVNKLLAADEGMGSFLERPPHSVVSHQGESHPASAQFLERPEFRRDATLMPNRQEFAGTPRFRILRKLGQGGMGVVYEAEDKERRIRVALKTLVFVTPAGLYRFKQEFRSISDIVHPNLILLYELFAQGDVWFFTMEFVEGQDFVESTRSETASWRAGGARDTISHSLFEAPDSCASSRPSLSGFSNAFAGVTGARLALPANVQRTRSLARQVAAGLCAVHAAGKLHRDVKSSNVLITPQGRAVVLDFGLASEFEEANVESASGEIVGTLAYMSPEQIAGWPLSPASDWYSFGVMLYHALTSKMPFHGSKAETVRQKLEIEPPSPGQIASGIPADLDQLCVELLRNNPTKRPTGKEVLDWLKSGDTVTQACTSFPMPRPAMGVVNAFVGRRQQEQALLHALAAARTGTAAIALVHGPSGVGKSALVQHFIEGHELHNVLILRGRCYEQESVPYKAFDSAVDMLCRYLRRDPSVATLIPDDIGPLVQIFPAFRQIDELADLPLTPFDQGDVQDLRRRAFHSFRELLARLRQRQQVMLCLDDLHWGDVESARLLSALLAPPSPPAILVCCIFRSEYEQRIDFLKMLFAHKANGAFQQFDVPLEPLGSDEALELAGKLVSLQGVQSGDVAQRIAEESGGNPYFICELARCSGEPAAHGDLSAVIASLDQIIWRRVSTLPETAQRLLCVISLFGQPLAQADAYEAAGFSTRDPAPLGSLRYESLIRTAGTQELDCVEPFHDRVRETVLSRLSDDYRRELHTKIVATLERTGRTDAETLGVHSEGAGNLAKAIRLYEVAAEQSSAALAFDRTAKLLERVLSLGDHPPAARSVLEAKLADALANAGLGLRAAQGYERAAELAAAEQKLEFERSAAFHFCSSGHLEEGLAIFQRVLRRVGLRLSSPRIAMLKFVLHLLQLRMHGRHFRERLPAEIPAKTLELFDAAWAVAAPMVQVDLLQSLNFGTLCLLLGLRAGDPVRLVRATLVGAYLISVQGKQGRRMADWLVKRSEDYAAQFRDPHLLASVALSRTGISYIGAEWRDCCKYALEAEQILTHECKGVRWEVASLWTLYLYSLYTLGEFAELGRRAEPLLGIAEEREDLYSYANIVVFCKPLVLLAGDRPQEARDVITKGLSQWPYSGFHLQHVMAAHARVWIDFYEGRGVESLESVRAAWQTLRENSFHNHPNLNTIWQDNLARTALAAAANSLSTRERARHLRLARKIAQKLATNRFPWAQATAFVIRGGLASLRGERQAGADFMLEAARRFQAQDMAGYAASARRRAGELRGGEAGKQLVAEADDWMRSQKIVRPDRMTEVHVGGYTDSL